MMVLNLTEVSRLLCSLRLTQIQLLMTANGLNLTQIPQIPQISLNFSFDGVKSHGGFTAALLP